MSVFASLAGFNLVDLILLALIGYSVIRGVKTGAAVQLGAYGGFWAGLILGAVGAPLFAQLFSPGIARTIVSLVIVLGTASILAGFGRFAGSWVSRYMKHIYLGPLDSVLGGGISAVALLLGVWIFAPVVVNSPFQSISSEVAGSKIVGLLDNAMPPAPSVFARLDGLMGSAGFPSVFATLPPALAGPVQLPRSSTVQAVAAKVEASTVKIEGVGCGNILEGSGFVIAPGLVVTNAHVVAGIANPVVIDSTGDHPARAIWFNPKFDLAVLSAPGVNDPALTIDTNEVTRGTKAVVLGYPEGGPLTIGSAGVMAAFDAKGRDIYNQGLTIRLVYQLEAIIRPGNSGGPLIDTQNGEVIGVVFSRSTTNPHVGFALASPGVMQQINDSKQSHGYVSTGACVD